LQTQLLTFITDFGFSDGTLALLKSNILQQSPTIQFLDINNVVKPFHIVEAAYLAENLFHRFPVGSYHFVATNIFMETDLPLLVASYQGHYFIGIDNGIFSLIFKSSAVQYRLMAASIDDDWNMQVANTVAKLQAGVPFEQLGLPHLVARQLVKNEPFYKDNYIEGAVLFTDNFGNVITNIQRDFIIGRFHLEKVRVNFGASHRIQGILPGIANASDHEPFAIFNSFGYLLLGMKNYHFARLFDVKDGMKISMSEIK